MCGRVRPPASNDTTRSSISWLCSSVISRCIQTWPPKFPLAVASCAEARSILKNCISCAPFLAASLSRMESGAQHDGSRRSAIVPLEITPTIGIPAEPFQHRLRSLNGERCELLRCDRTEIPPARMGERLDLVEIPEPVLAAFLADQH